MLQHSVLNKKQESCGSNYQTSYNNNKCCPYDSKMGEQQLQNGEQGNGEKGNIQEQQDLQIDDNWEFLVFLPNFLYQYPLLLHCLLLYLLHWMLPCQFFVLSSISVLLLVSILALALVLATSTQVVIVVIVGMVKKCVNFVNGWCFFVNLLLCNTF